MSLLMRLLLAVSLGLIWWAWVIYEAKRRPIVPPKPCEVNQEYLRKLREAGN